MLLLFPVMSISIYIYIYIYMMCGIVGTVDVQREQNFPQGPGIMIQGLHFSVYGLDLGVFGACVEGTLFFCVGLPHKHVLPNRPARRKALNARSHTLNPKRNLSNPKSKSPSSNSLIW